MVRLVAEAGLEPAELAVAPSRRGSGVTGEDHPFLMLTLEESQVSPSVIISVYV